MQDERALPGNLENREYNFLSLSKCSFSLYFTSSLCSLLLSLGCWGLIRMASSDVTEEGILSSQNFPQWSNKWLMQCSLPFRSPFCCSSVEWKAVYKKLEEIWSRTVRFELLMWLEASLSLILTRILTPVALVCVVNSGSRYAFTSRVI
jgi:hypothetical protein